MNIRELEAQAKALAPVLKGFVAKALSSFKTDLQSELDERDRRLAEKVSESFEGIPTDAAEIARVAAALIPTPQNGRDADPEEIARAVAAEFAKSPVPTDGKSVSVEDVLPAIQEHVESLIAALPTPADGKDIDPETVRQLVSDEVAKLPIPADGKSVTSDDLLPIIKDLIIAETAKLPAPKNGEDGKSVSIDEIQVLIDRAVEKALSAIPLPKDGEPGRDALHIEILPAIDTEKTYPRGMYAKHAGGLWRSYEATAELKGWECIVEGLSSFILQRDGERGFKAVAQMSSGRIEEKSLQLPAMIYRGVFIPKDYEPGDTVTWAGSLWHCDDPTSDKPGEPGSKGWRLAVKRGRDGKDGLNGKDMTKGVKIE